MKHGLEEALHGHFDDHHGLICQMMLERIDDLTARIDEITDTIDEAVAPYATQIARLDEVTGIGTTAAQDLIAELGVDMSVFPTAAHLVSWAKFAPQARQSAGKAKQATTGKGNPWLAGTIGEVVATASRTNTFLAERYRRLAKHRGKQRAIVAVGNSVLTFIWHLLSDPETRYHDLGPDFYQSRINPQRQQRNLVHQLERLTGQKVTLAPRPEQPATV